MKPTTTIEQDYWAPAAPADRAVVEYTGKESLRALAPLTRAQCLQEVLGLSEEATELVALAISAAENSTFQQAIDLASRRTLVEASGPQRSGYETFRRSIIADLRRAKWKRVANDPTPQ